MESVWRFARDKRRFSPGRSPRYPGLWRGGDCNKAVRQLGLILPGGIERIAKELGIIVLDPMAIAGKTAEMFVDLKLPHRKMAYS
jgi:hypothetical protein